MKIRMAVVDLSALPARPHQMVAARDVHQASDRFWALRAVCGASAGRGESRSTRIRRRSVVPSPFHVLRFGDGLLGIVHVEEE